MNVYRFQNFNVPTRPSTGLAVLIKTSTLQHGNSTFQRGAVLSGAEELGVQYRSLAPF